MIWLHSIVIPWCSLEFSPAMGRRRAQLVNTVKVVIRLHFFEYLAGNFVGPDTDMSISVIVIHSISV